MVAIGVIYEFVLLVKLACEIHVALEWKSKGALTDRTETLKLTDNVNKVYFA